MYCMGDVGDVANKNDFKSSGVVFCNSSFSDPLGDLEGLGHREHATRRLHLPRLHLEAVHLVRHQSHAPSPLGRHRQMLPLHPPQE